MKAKNKDGLVDNLAMQLRTTIYIMDLDDGSYTSPN